jgi:cytochrome P450
VSVSGQWHIINRTLHDRYGAIVRVAPNKISVRGEIGWKAVYAHRTQGTEEWPKAEDFFSGTPPDIVTAPTATHRRMRKEIIRAFSDKAIYEQQPIFRQYSKLLLQRWRERDQTVIDLSKWLNFFTFDTFGDLAFGEPFGSLEGGESHPWISLIFNTIKIGKKIRFLDEFPMTKKVIMFFMPTSIKRRAADHYDLSITKVRKRMARDVGDRKDFISYIMKTDGTGLTDEEMERNASTLIVAGSETTATTLSAAIYFLLKRPEKYARFTEEIRSAFKGGDEEITLQACAALPYLQACVEEALRLFPAVPIGAPRQVTTGDGYIENIYLPEKVILDLLQPQHASLGN